MITDPLVRRERLKEIRERKDPYQPRQKLFYKGESKLHDVSRVPLDLLIYNRHNGRVDAEMMTWQKEHSAPADLYTEEFDSIIDSFLWHTNEAKNEATLTDLRIKGQQRPGIVSLDGVVIDGNRRFMLLRRLQNSTNSKQHFDAIILPDAYDENAEEIVRLETQYQLGEDEKLEYGPLQKYLHARRLSVDFGVDNDEIAILMNIKPAEVKRLLDTMELMDDYLEHVGCAGLYTMLGDKGGTKEGMLVDLNSDLNRLRNSTTRVPWAYDSELDVLQLQTIQFDYIRMYELADAKKTYREISH